MRGRGRGIGRGGWRSVGIERELKGEVGEKKRGKKRRDGMWWDACMYDSAAAAEEVTYTRPIWR